jgi:DNA polymerase III delta prime subunit
VPSVTFVEPDDFFVLKLALEQPGRGVVIEGPSGVGKTTALETAINELEGAGASERFTKLRARDPEHVARIAELRSWHRGPVSIDDFHRLDATVRSDLVDYLKLLADTEMEDRKLVIVGIPGTRQQLVQFAFDVATRIDVLTLGAVSDDKVKEMIEKGEAALNIELLGKSEIVRTAAGSLLIAQKLCQHSAALAGIRETQATFTPVTSDLPRAVGTVMEQMASKFGGLVQSFAALDGPSHRLCIELLMELAVTKDGTLPLRSLRERRADLAAGIDRFIENRLMGTLAERHEDHDQHLLYEHETATLVIDDPQLTFYLRQLTPEQLAAEAGKAPLVKRMRVFVSYSHAHEDAKWLQRLRVHLAPLERDGLIDLWDDTRIAAGSLWRDEINAALDTAKAAVLLISADFLASDFIQDKELPPLLSTAAGDGCTVLPLLLSPSLFEETPELSRFQAVNRHGTPLSAMSASEGETTLVELTKRIAQLVRQHP